MNRPWHHICLRDWGHMDPTEYADEITGLRREIRRLTAEADDARPSQRVEAIRRRDHADDKLAWAIASGGAVVLRRTGECTCSDEQATESSKKISVQWAVADWFKTECAARRRAS